MPEPLQRPVVSVIVPVWNVAPYLRQCIDSVLRQSIGLERLELIAVDDGSTDGSETVLDDYAASQPRVLVVHQPNSGGPGAPRNAGLDLAGGRYVFFLDADDYLGPEALERMVAMAERNHSDIVLGKVVGVEGRRTLRGSSVFEKNRDRARVQHVYRSGSVLKLFRRSFFHRTGLRFPEGQAGGEDGDLMARAYFEARRISVLADYDCYFARRREGSLTLREDVRVELAERIRRVEHRRFEVVARYRRPGPGRDRLLLRHVRKLMRKFGQRWLRMPEDQRRRAFEAAAAVLERWQHPVLDRALPASGAIRAWCLRHGLRQELEDIAGVTPASAYRKPLVEGRRVYARYPHFRDGSGIPDWCFDITREIKPIATLETAGLEGGRLHLAGEAYLTLVGGTTSVELRRWPRGPQWRFRASRRATPELRDMYAAYPSVGFEAVIDLATAAGGRPLPRGLWSVHLAIGTDAFRRSLRARLPGTRGRTTVLGRWNDTVLTASPALRLRIGQPSQSLRSLQRLAGAMRWARRLGDRALRATRAGRSIRRAVHAGQAALHPAPEA